MEDALDYKTAKEGFVANQTGSTLNHINLISLVALTSLSFYSTVRVRSHLLPSSPSLALFSAQFVLLVVPLLIAVTVAAKPPGWDVLKVDLLLAGAAVAVYIGTKERIAWSRNSLPHSTKVDQTVDDGNRQNASGNIPFLPAVTNWRAHMMLMTSLCILAVDFPVFPRDLAKCETFGVSLVCIKLS
jgi:phosphatidylinositol glycan class W